MDKQLFVGRSPYLDIVRGVATILVVLGHSIQVGSGSEFLQNESFFNDALFQGIYSFHMPLFILISGYLFSFTIKRHSFSENVKSRFSGILFPAALWSIAHPLVKWFINIWLYGPANSAIDISNLPGNLLFGILNDFWFLWAVFYCSIIVLIVNQYLKDSPLVYTVLFILLLFVDDYTLANHKFMFPYFVIAYFVGKYDVIRFITARWWGKVFIGVLSISAGLGWGLLLPLYNRDSFIYTTGNSLRKVERWGFTLQEQVLRIGYRYVIGALGCVFILWIIYILCKVLSGKGKYLVPLEWLGQKSIAVYCASGLFSGWIYNVLLQIIPVAERTGVKLYMINIFETVVILLVVSVMVRCLEKSRLFRIYFMGGR